MDEVFEIDGTYYKIPKDSYESREYYMERVWYILKHVNSDNNIINLIKESKIRRNIKQFGCDY